MYTAIESLTGYTVNRITSDSMINWFRQLAPFVQAKSKA